MCNNEPAKLVTLDGWTREDGTLLPEQTLQVRHESNRPGNSVRMSHLKVGDVTAHFRTRTAR